MDLSFAESRERSPMRTVDTRLRSALPFVGSTYHMLERGGPGVLLAAENGRSGRASGSTVIKATVATTTRDGTHAPTTVNTPHSFPTIPGSIRIIWIRGQRDSLKKTQTREAYVL